MNFRRFFSELKRRNVYKLAIKRTASLIETRRVRLIQPQ